MDREERLIRADEGIDNGSKNTEYLASCAQCGYALNYIYRDHCLGRIKGGGSYDPDPDMAMAQLRTMIDKCEPVEERYHEAIRKQYAWESRRRWNLTGLIAVLMLFMAAASSALVLENMPDWKVVWPNLVILGLAMCFMSYVQLLVYRRWRKSKLRLYLKTNRQAENKR
jgi:hypothetical protein